MSDESKGELVAGTPKAYYPANLLPNVDQFFRQQAVYTTLDLSKPESQGKLYDMVVGTNENAKEHINKEFVIVNLTIHPVVKTDKETGEMIPLPRIIIETEDGNVIQMFSTGIWQCIQAMKLTGWTPFGNVRQPFMLKAIDIGGDRQIYKLIRPPVKPLAKSSK